VARVVHFAAFGRCECGGLKPIGAKLKKMLQEESSFSEEKEAKRLLVHGTQGRCSTELHTKRTKSLLLLFARKEESSLT